MRGRAVLWKIRKWNVVVDKMFFTDNGERERQTETKTERQKGSKSVWALNYESMMRIS